MFTHILGQEGEERHEGQAGHEVHGVAALLKHSSIVQQEYVQGPLVFRVLKLPGHKGSIQTHLVIIEGLGEVA